MAELYTSTQFNLPSQLDLTLLYQHNSTPPSQLCPTLLNTTPIHHNNYTLPSQLYTTLPDEHNCNPPSQLHSTVSTLLYQHNFPPLHRNNLTQLDFTNVLSRSRYQTLHGLVTKPFKSTPPSNPTGSTWLHQHNWTLPSQLEPTPLHHQLDSTGLQQQIIILRLPSQLDSTQLHHHNSTQLYSTRTTLLFHPNSTQLYSIDTTILHHPQLESTRLHQHNITILYHENPSQLNKCIPKTDRRVSRSLQPLLPQCSTVLSTPNSCRAIQS